MCLEPPCAKKRCSGVWTLLVLLAQLFLALHLTVKLLQCSLDRTPCHPLSPLLPPPRCPRHLPITPHGEEVPILTGFYRELQFANVAATLMCQTHCDLPFVCVRASVFGRQSGFIQSSFDSTKQSRQIVTTFCTNCYHVFPSRHDTGGFMPPYPSPLHHLVLQLTSAHSAV